LPLAAPRREHGAAVEFLSNLSDAGNALSANVFHDCVKVVCVLLRLLLDRCYRFLVADLLAS
jgi:hypothetical protein